MVFTIACVLGGCVLGACRHTSAEIPIQTPHAELLDGESERLHAQCQVGEIASLDRGEVDAHAEAVHANFVEIVYARDASHLGVVLFRCPPGVELPAGASTSREADGGGTRSRDGE